MEFQQKFAEEAFKSEGHPIVSFSFDVTEIFETANFLSCLLELLNKCGVLLGYKKGKICDETVEILGCCKIFAALEVESAILKRE